VIKLLEFVSLGNKKLQELDKVQFTTGTFVFDGNLGISVHV